MDTTILKFEICTRVLFFGFNFFFVSPHQHRAVSPLPSWLQWANRVEQARAAMAHTRGSMSLACSFPVVVRFRSDIKLNMASLGYPLI